MDEGADGLAESIVHQLNMAAGYGQRRNKMNGEGSGCISLSSGRGEQRHGKCLDGSL